MSQKTCDSEFGSCYTAAMTLTYVHKISVRSVFVLALGVLAACPGKPNESGTDTDATDSDATDSAGTTSAATEDPTEANATEPTAVTAVSESATGTEGETVDSASTTVDPTVASEPTSATDTDPTGETGEGPVAECMAACAHLAECVPDFGDVAECTAECADTYAGEPACADAGAALGTCLAGLSCPDLLKFLEEEEDSGLCKEELAATDEVCAPPCTMVAGIGEEGQCSLGRSCSDQPLEDYVCDGETCTCEVDGVPGASCPAEGFCSLESSEEQTAAVVACCGFDW